jgi:hypothetical protein
MRQLPETFLQVVREFEEEERGLIGLRLVGARLAADHNTFGVEASFGTGLIVADE